MNAFRQDITARKREFLELIEKVESATGQRIEAECYKRPKPTDDADLARFFAWKGAKFVAAWYNSYGEYNEEI